MTDQQPDTRSGHANKPRKPLNWKQRLMLPPAVWLVTLFTWVVRLTCRITVVAGSDQIAAAQARGGVMIPCGWHRWLLISGIFLAKKLPRDMRAGFLISPSREGEFIARVASNHGTSPVRGSSSHSGGSLALQAALDGMKKGISPMMFGDGPRGPAGQFKRGAVVLAQRTGKPMLPLGIAINRYWQIRSWDQTLIPKPFAHYSVALGELWDVSPDCTAEDVDAIAQQVGQKLDDLTALAQADL